jgi:hypothetical protein
MRTEKVLSMRNRPSLDMESADALILDSPDSSTISNRFMLLINYPITGIFS